MNRNLIITLFVLALTATQSMVNAQVPTNLNSFPSASATIYLDFDGHTVISPYWNGGNPIFCAPAALTTAQMTRIFNHVSEDFRPFNLNITTDSTVYFAAPINRRQRVIVTPTSSWYGSAGGVAYVESFRWGLEIPAFVFSNLLSNNVKMVAEASSHEAGHTLGLYHQSQYTSTCGFSAEYNPGTGSGEIGWAPIMGNSYSRNLTLWHNGPNSFGCNSLQNDLNIIAGTSNGFGYRTDDVGNTSTAASNVLFTGNDYAISGFINSTSDVDMYRLNLSVPGRFVLSGIPFNVASGWNAANIDMQVSLVDANGTVISNYNPSTSVQALADSTLNAGTYYIRVTNSSNANTSNYGMLGNYALNGTFTASSTLPIYSLTLNGGINKNKHELSWNIIADEPIDVITVEMSFDGRTFTKLQDLSGTLRKFAYQPFENKTAFYRLHVVTASQLTYYSNIVSLKEVETNAKFSLLSNMISGNEIVVNSKTNITWRLVDMNGRGLQQGRMQPGMNRLQTGTLTGGMYLLQLSDGETTTTERLVKR
jgi:hypothetical protein